MIWIVAVTFAALATRNAEIRGDSSAPMCFAVGDSTKEGRGGFFVRLDADGRIAFSIAVAPSTPPDRWWSWERVGNVARIKFGGIDSGEDFSLEIGRSAQRVTIDYWFANGGPRRWSDTLDVRMVDCPTVREAVK